MKLILKRVGPDPKSSGPIDHVMPRPDLAKDGRPFALCTDAGDALPCQQSTALISKPDGMVELHVVFQVDGRDLLVEGDA